MFSTFHTCPTWRKVKKKKNYDQGIGSSGGHWPAKIGDISWGGGGGWVANSGDWRGGGSVDKFLVRLKMKL